MITLCQFSGSEQSSVLIMFLLKYSRQEYFEKSNTIFITELAICLSLLYSLVPKDQII